MCQSTTCELSEPFCLLNGCFVTTRKTFRMNCEDEQMEVRSVLRRKYTVFSMNCGGERIHNCGPTMETPWLFSGIVQVILDERYIFDSSKSQLANPDFKSTCFSQCHFPLFNCRLTITPELRDQTYFLEQAMNCSSLPCRGSLISALLLRGVMSSYWSSGQSERS